MLISIQKERKNERLNDRRVDVCRPRVLRADACQWLHKKGCTYVAPNVRTAPDATEDNNYSTRDNTNPYTRKDGTVTLQPPNPYTLSPTAPAPPCRIFGAILSVSKYPRRSFRDAAVAAQRGHFYIRGKRPLSTVCISPTYSAKVVPVTFLMGTTVNTDGQSNNRKGRPSYPVEFKHRVATAACEPGVSVSNRRLDSW